MKFERDGMKLYADNHGGGQDKLRADPTDLGFLFFFGGDSCVWHGRKGFRGEGVEM